MTAPSLTEIIAEGERLDAAYRACPVGGEESAPSNFCPECFSERGGFANGETCGRHRNRGAIRQAIDVLQELEQSARYWSDYDVPLGIVERITFARQRLESVLEVAP